MRLLSAFLSLGLLSAAPFVPADLSRMRAVQQVAFSPDGTRIAYTVQNHHAPGMPYSQLWVLTLADGNSVRLAEGQDNSGSPVWSPDGAFIAYSGRAAGKTGLIVARADGSSPRWLAPLGDTNHPLPSRGARFAWSPDSKRLVFVDATPGPETADATGDPVVITRYIYKPDLDEGNTRFNDNKRLHLFTVDLASGAIRQLTRGNHYEHSVDWSPKGNEILFVSNREPNEDQFFNYDLFAINPDSEAIRRLTATENIEYRPRFSPDARFIVYQGCKRGLTDLETTMEDTHVWTTDADGARRRELVTIDNRQGPPSWSPDGNTVYFTVQSRGSVHLYRQPFPEGPAQPLITEPGAVSAVSPGPIGQLAYVFTAPGRPAELYLRSANGQSRRLTDLNATSRGTSPSGVPMSAE
ncbi:MAG: hypothetical protein SFV54_13785 [Bryobacteraceae bacterium]|nr:hypothetical protein [Bryobacteraceae bacterium]